MEVLLSIKPEFAKKIFDGSKRFEFRKSIFKNKGIRKVIVYASSPMQKVIGEFEIETILSNNPKKLWEKTHEFSGISKEHFDNYFIDKKVGYAIQIKSCIEYELPLCLKKDFSINTPPQSFMYLKSVVKYED